MKTKRHIASVLALLIALVCVASHRAGRVAAQAEVVTPERRAERLLAMPADERLEALRDLGLRLPPELDEPEALDALVERVLRDVANGGYPYGAVPYSYTVLADLALEVEGLLSDAEPQAPRLPRSPERRADGELSREAWVDQLK